MNVKQECLDLYEGVLKEEPNLFFDEYKTNISGPGQNVEIKQEIEWEEPKIEKCSDLLPKIENEVKVTDIGDIKEYKIEFLSIHCDLPTLKNENTEYSDCLTESCDRDTTEIALKNKKRRKKPRLPQKDFDGHFLKHPAAYTFIGDLKKIDLQNSKPHTNEKLFKCDVCSKTFTRNSNLQTHLRTHTNEKPFKCNICYKEFNDKRNSQRHLRNHTNEKPFKCNMCCREFKLKCNLVSHLKTHTSQKPFKCDICSKEFNQKYYLKKHLKIHTNEKSFQCNICSKKFTHKCNLQTHLRTHTNEKPFKCNICSKKFIHKSNLHSHSIIHTNEKKFKCNMCSKKFNHNCNLQTHLRTHTN